MNFRIVKIDLSETNEQLRRIADALELIIGSTNPIPANIDDFPDEKSKQRIFYTDDKQEIVDYHLRRLKK